MGKFSETDAVWPRFEMVSLPSEAGVPEDVAHYLEKSGVPRDLLNGIYSALPVAKLVADDLVAFGAEGDGDGRICIDIGQGAVVSIASERHVGNRHLVNSNIENFTACVAAIIERFPFYLTVAGADESYVVFENASSDIDRIVSEIDPSACSESEGFWTELIATASVGDLSVDDVLDD